MEVTLDSMTLNIINVYSRARVITSDLDSVCKDLGLAVILGDFNIHHSVRSQALLSGKWYACRVDNCQSLLHHKHDCNDSYCSRWKRSLTGTVLCSADSLPKIFYTIENDLWDSNHFPVQLTMSLTPPHLRPKTQYRWLSIINEVNEALIPVDRSFLPVHHSDCYEQTQQN